MKHYRAGQAIRCPQCGRAQDIVAPGAEVTVRRVQRGEANDGLERICRRCGTTLEIRVTVPRQRSA